MLSCLVLVLASWQGLNCQHDHHDDGKFIGHLIAILVIGLWLFVVFDAYWTCMCMIMWYVIFVWLNDCVIYYLTLFNILHNLSNAIIRYLWSLLLTCLPPTLPSPISLFQVDAALRKRRILDGLWNPVALIALSWRSRNSTVLIYLVFLTAGGREGEWCGWFVVGGIEGG